MGLRTWLLLGIIFFCLSSCGFHVRGAIPLSPQLKEVYLQTDDPYGQLTRNLKEYLSASNVELVDTPAAATAILHIINETQGQQLLSISGTQQTRQYNLTLSITFEITNPRGVVLMPPLTLTENRTLTTLSNLILGGTNEQNILYQQMRMAIVYDIMNRLGSREVTHLLTEQKTPS